MSRRLLSSHCRVPDTGYQLAAHTCARPRAAPPPKLCRNNGHHAPAPDTEDAATDSQTYYDYDYHHHGYRERFGTDRSYSDESGSVRLPSCQHDDDDDSSRRVSRTAYSSDRSYGRRGREVIGVHRGDVRRVFPAPIAQYQEPPGVYQEIAPQAEAPKLAPASRLSDRPQSSMSSGVTSAIVDGCGGKCQTFQNVCYFILQLAFMMGILIGVSLCIAGLVLRKSAARNLQVLVYIGAMLAVVSGVLLGIQLNARNAAKRRKLAIKNAKRAPIPLETLNTRGQQQQPLMVVTDGQRVVPQILRPLPPQPDQQGIPWWRRKDLS